VKSETKSLLWQQLRNAICRKEGFTIQEILVVILVGSLLIGFSLSLFLFTNKLFQTWYGNSEMKNSSNRILQQIALDIQQSREIIGQTDTSLVLSKGIGKIVHYIYEGKTLQRNEVDLTPEKSAAVKIKIEMEKDNIPMELRGHVFRIKLLAQSKSIDYEIETDAMAAPSSRSQFKQFQWPGQ
jgi:hypothetical protein